MKRKVFFVKGLLTPVYPLQDKESKRKKSMLLKI